MAYYFLSLYIIRIEQSWVLLNKLRPEVYKIKFTKNDVLFAPIDIEYTRHANLMQPTVLNSSGYVHYNSFKKWKKNVFYKNNLFRCLKRSTVSRNCGSHAHFLFTKHKDIRLTNINVKKLKILEILPYTLNETLHFSYYSSYIWLLYRFSYVFSI